MKKLFIIITLAFAFICMSCEETSDITLQIKNESSKELDNVVFQGVLFAKKDADIIGTWTGNRIVSNIKSDTYTSKLEITKSNWTLITLNGGRVSNTVQGNWTREGNVLTLKYSNAYYGSKTATAILLDDTLTLRISFSAQGTIGVWDTYEHTSSNLQKSLKPGNMESKAVEAGAGYIFFTVNSTACRTSNVIVIADNDNEIFTFTDNTVVVKVDNSDIAGTLGSLFP